MKNNSYSAHYLHQVDSFQDLATTPFYEQVNAMCWSRNLIGDFEEITTKIELDSNILELNVDELRNLELSENGQLARDIILNDLQLLKRHGADPILNIIENYDRDDSYPLFPTDVYSFHVDRSPIPTDTFLCTYYGASSDILPNADGIQKILVPEIRTELKKLYDGPDAGFESFLTEYFFDLHYQPKPDAHIINLGVGHMWKLATDHPQSNVLPCLHRAPKENTEQKRLMLIC